eukprot:8142798-Pyramimonas_sp.AAC.1
MSGITSGDTRWSSRPRGARSHGALQVAHRRAQEARVPRDQSDATSSTRRPAKEATPMERALLWALDSTKARHRARATIAITTIWRGHAHQRAHWQLSARPSRLRRRRRRWQASVVSAGALTN